MGLSLSHLLIVLVVAVMVFGTKRLPSFMADLAKGLRAFKNGLKEEEDKPPLSIPPSKPEKDV